MLRPRIFATCLTFGVIGLSTLAAAEPLFPLTTPTTDQPSFGPQQGAWRRIAIKVDPKPGDVAPALVSPTIYLDRCTGGCTLTGGGEDNAQTRTSAIGAGTLSEFQNSAGEIGALADEEWNEFVTCMKEVYSPYMVNITDVKPAAGVPHHLAIVAGTPQQVGQDGMVLGVAIVRGDCAPRENAISLSFANAHPNSSTRAYDLCHTVAQESAHAFGLDHAFEFLDGRSTCNDPMTYRFDCGGQRFFRNDTAKCGEFAARPCGITGGCGQSQNSHLKILTVFGAGMSIVPKPTVSVSTPAAGGQLGAVVGAQAGSKRGVAKVELMLNGFKWAEAKGGAFGQNGQPNPGNYTLNVPSNVPSSTIDIVVRAYDDLGAFTDSTPVTVVKGAPCTGADSCAKGQKCEMGRCFWDPPAGELGDDCTFPQFCKSGICQGTAEQQICTQSCVPGVGDSCPENLECLMTGAAQGICFLPPEEGGCCSVSDDDGVPWAHVGATALLFGLLIRRRRK